MRSFNPGANFTSGIRRDRHGKPRRRRRLTFEFLEPRRLLAGWTELDESASDGGLTRGTGNSRFAELAADSHGNTYVAWLESDPINGAPRVHVAAWNYENLPWVGLDGTEAGTRVSGESQVVSNPISLAAEPVTGQPTVAWLNYSVAYGTNDVYVRHWNGVIWEELGRSASEGGISNTRAASEWDVRVAYGPQDHPGLYVSYKSSSELVVKRWNPQQARWDPLTSIADGSGTIDSPDLTIGRDGNPIVAWTHSTTTTAASTSEIYVLRWTGSAWEQLGGSASGGGVSSGSGRSRGASLATDDAGRIVVAWEVGHQAGVLLRRWNGILWESLGGSAAGAGLGVGGSPDVAIGADGNPIVSWVRAGTVLFDSNIIAKRWSGAQWEGLAESAGPFGLTPEIRADVAPRTAIGGDDVFVAWTGWTPDGNNVYLRTFANQPEPTVPTLTYRDSQHFELPTPSIAVGPNHILQVVNSTLAVFDKTEGFNRFQQHLDSFFEPLDLVEPYTGCDIFDGSTVYDESLGRFVVTALQHRSVFGETYVLYAVSKTADPLAGFDFYQIAVSGQVMGRSLRLGLNADLHVLTLNVYSDSPFSATEVFDRVQVLAIDKSSIGQAQLRYASVPRSTSFSLVPAVMHDSVSGDPMWFVEEAGGGNGNRLRLVRMDGGRTPTPTVSEYYLNVEPYTQPPLMTQGFVDAPSDLRRLDPGGTAIRSVQWRGQRLVAAHHVGISTDDSAHVRWYEISTSTSAPQLLQHGTLAPGPGTHTAVPAIAIAGNGDIGLTYLQSSVDEPLSVYVTGRTPSDLPGLMQRPMLVRQGTMHLATTFLFSGPINIGSFGSLAVDPASNSFWLGHEYAATVLPAQLPFVTWGTAIGKFHVTESSAPVVLAHAPQGVVTQSVAAVDFSFSMAMNASSFSTAADVVQFTGPGGDLRGQISGFQWLDNHTLRLAFAPQAATGEYVLRIGPQILATNGQAMDEDEDGVPEEISADTYTATFSVQRTAGTDAHGYYEAFGYPFQDVDLREGDPGVSVIHRHGDNNVTRGISLPPGTTFNFYGVKYGDDSQEQVFVSEDGKLSLGTTSNSPAEISPLQDTWEPHVNTSGRTLQQSRDTNGDGTPDWLIIEWSEVVYDNSYGSGDLPFADSPSTVSFQTWLELNTGDRPGTIVFNYLDVETGDTHAAGRTAVVEIRDPPNTLTVSNHALSPFIGSHKAVAFAKRQDPYVERSSPSGPTPAPVDHVDLHFSEPMRADSFSIADDIASFSVKNVAIPVTGESWLDSQTLRLFFAPQSTLGEYALELGPFIESALDGANLDQDRDEQAGEIVEDRFRTTFRIGDIAQDDFGYRAHEYPFRDYRITGGTTVLKNANNETYGLTLPTGKTFNLYGRTHEYLKFTENGVIYASGLVTHANGDLTNDAATIAVLWDNWLTVSWDDRQPNQVRYEYRPDANGTEWLGIDWEVYGSWTTTFPTTSQVVFQVWLELNTGTRPGDILFNYFDLDAGHIAFNNGVGATVGIKGEGVQAPNRLPISINATSPFIAAGKAIRITTRPPNQAPTISAIADQTIDENTSTPTLDFEINDAETAPASLKILRQSSNPTLVPLDNIVLGGSGANRTVTVTPAAGEVGTAAVTIQVQDTDGQTASSTFLVEVLATRPEIALLAGGSGMENGDKFTGFGGVPIEGEGVEIHFAVVNTGRRNLNLTGVQISGLNPADFTLVSQPSTPVAPDETAPFQVQFKPLAWGKREATLSVLSDDADEGQYVLTLKGMGLAAPVVNSMTSSASAVLLYDTLQFIAAGVSDPDGAVARVIFLDETNGEPGLQVGEGGDSWLGADGIGGDGWSLFVQTGLPVLSLDVGVHTVYAQAIDEDGLRSDPVSVAVTVAPAFSTTPAITGVTADTGASPADGITADRTLVIHGTADAGVPVEVFRDGTFIGTATADSSGHWSLDHTGTLLAEGTYQFRAMAVVRPGAASDLSAPFPVTVDSTPPAPPTGLDLATEDDSGLSSTDNWTRNTSGLTISGAAETGATVQFFDDADGDGLFDVGESLGTATATGGTFTRDVALTAGTHSVRAFQSDAAGNVGPASAALSITVDTTPPAVTVAGLTTDDTTPVLTGTVDDGVLQATVNGKTYTAGDGRLAVSGSSWALQIPSGDALPVGTYEVAAVSTDTAGNVGTDTTTKELTITDTATISVPAPAGIVGWWPGNGTAQDRFDGNHGTLLGGVTANQPGYVETAFTFDGVDDRVSVSGTGQVTGPRSIEAWVLPRLNSGDGLPIVTLGTAGVGDFFGIAGGADGYAPYEVYVDHWGSPGYRSYQTLTPNQWNHVAVTYDGATVRFCVNGQAVTAVTAPLYDAALNTMTIGGNTIGGTTTKNSFNGQIDELTLYNRALTTDEILGIVAAGRGGKSLPYVDLAEPNDTRETAHNLGGVSRYLAREGMTIHDPLNVDWYRFETVRTGREGDRVQVTFDHAQGNVELALVPPTGVQEFSFGTSNQERMWLQNKAPGVYHILVFCSQGGTSPNYKLEIDLVPSVPSISGVTSDSGPSPTDGITNDATLVVLGTADAGVMVEVFRDGAVIGTAMANALGNWSLDNTGTTLAEGTYQFTAKAVNPSGNASGLSAPFIVNVDTLPPVVTVTYQTTDDATPALTGTVEQGTLRITVGGTTYTAGDGKLAVNGTTWTLQIPDGHALAAGAYDVAAVSTDSAGNVGTDATVNELAISGSAWHNLTSPCDVTGDGNVTALDVLTVVNYINVNPGQVLLPAAPPGSHPYHDVTGDGLCTPDDVLEVINFLNRDWADGAEGEAAPDQCPADCGAVAPSWEMSTGRQVAVESPRAWHEPSEFRGTPPGPASLGDSSSSGASVVRLEASRTLARLTSPRRGEKVDLAVGPFSDELAAALEDMAADIDGAWTGRL